MRTTFSWKNGEALLIQPIVLMLIATLVSAEEEKPKEEGGGGEISCNKCDVKEDNYRGPIWSYPCMKGYQGPKKDDIKCTSPPNADGCFRRMSVVGGKRVLGSGGCFSNEKKACVEEVTKVKFNEATGCIPETPIDTIMNKELKEKCLIITHEDNKEEGASQAPAARRRREAADDAPRAIICVCVGDGCNNQGGGLGRSADNAVASIKPISTVWIGVIFGMSLIGGSLFVIMQA